MKSFVVIGLGRFGTRIAKTLYKMQCEVLAVDIDNEKVQQIADDVTQAVTGDAKDKDVLRALGVRNSDCVVVAVAGDISSSIFITMNLKELEGDRLIIRKEYPQIPPRVEYSLSEIGRAHV